MPPDPDRDHTIFHQEAVPVVVNPVAGISLSDELAFYLIAVYPPRMYRLEATLTIGRAPESDIVVDDGRLSRTHCKVQLVGRTTIVTDLNSTNGTFIGDHRIIGTEVLPLGASLRLGEHVFQLGRRSIREVEAAQALDRDLQRASEYVHSLLPPPITEGPAQTQWLFVPSTRLGGDGFGYDQLDERTRTGYILDVAGHGAGAAMHSVSVMNVLRNRALPGVDMRHPDAVVASLNTMFQMESHGGLFFTLWYGVYDSVDRVLRFCSAGHHPGYLVDANHRDATPLRTRNPAIGVVATFAFRDDVVPVAAGSSLYLFSDGCFEFSRNDGSPFTLERFLQLIMQGPVAGVLETQRLYDSVRQFARPGPFEDDASLVVIKFA